MVMCSRDYGNGKIYCIRNDINDDVYVGSTTQLLCKRMAKHRASINAKKSENILFYQLMRELGTEAFRIELIEEFPCENREQLQAREGFYIKKLGTLNKRVESRTKKEYYEDCKETILQKQKEHKEAHKEQIQEYKKQHYQDNKEYIKEKSKQNYHDNIEARKAQKKEYYYNNKDKMDEYQKLYRENNKEAIAERKKKCVESKKEYYKQQKKAYYEANKQEINRRRREKWQQKKAEEQK